ncbi:hypothetical protein ATG_03360 [Desulfurococcaceae archaeon AG1]|jgi:multiple sugar transport system permease protein|nr:MAG: hypothetical protein DJ555_01550 [Desulfurococcaceae archaeon]GAY25133.1 hypothetical protein ATG_03360 [Desulfurococcaceae archaeon AG1]
MSPWIKTLVYIALGVIAVWTLMPIYWMINVSLKVGLEVYEVFSASLSLDNYVRLFRGDFQRYLSNTAYLAFLTTSISLLLSIPAAYSLSKLPISRLLARGLLVWTLFSRTIPPIVLILPIYVMFSQLRLSDNLSAVAIAYQVYTLPFSLWMMLSFFRSTPREVEEAARVDGAGPITLLIRILLPLTMPGITVTAIFSILMSWNEFLYAVILLHSLKNYTVPLIIASYISEWGVKWGEMAAAGLISSLPMLLFTGYVQRHIVLGFMKR